MKMVEICPSVLNSKDVKGFLENINELKNEDIDNNIVYIHLDVMDKIFVKEEGVSLSLAQTISSFGFLPDIHLMVDDVRKYIDKVKIYKPAVITIHYEAPNFEKNLKHLNEIRNNKEIPFFDIGVSIKPNTDVEVLEKYKDKFDLILIMSVEPGLGGQSFIEKTYEKIHKAKIILGDKIIQLDGGINETNIDDIIKSGVDRIVIGSYLTSAKNIEELKLKYNKLKGEVNI